MAKNGSTGKSVDAATLKMLDHVEANGIETAWDRLKKMQPQCGFGQLGLCCRNCDMGPCRIDPFGNGPQKGVCGATADIIVARNFARMVAAGAAAHSDHGRDIAHTALMAAEGKTTDYTIKDETKLLALAKELGIPTEGRSINEIGRDCAERAFSEFGNQHGPIAFIERAPEGTKEDWKKLGVVPRGVDREVVEIMHRTHIGVDNDAENLIKQSIRASLADGWGGSMIATDFSDVLFGTPKPLKSEANLGVLKKDEVNIIVHGHEPTLSELIVAAASDPELLEEAKKKGAKGINVAGICCTANEVLMRHGVPLCGNFLQQELAIATGAVELMVVDVQCIMPALGALQNCFHTKIVSTSPKAKFPYMEHVEFDEEHAYEIAKKIVRMAVENYPNRAEAKVNIPDEKMDLVAGFVTEGVGELLGGKFRASLQPLIDAIVSGRIRGAAGVVGCNNPKYQHDSGHVGMTKELIKNDVLVVVTGCTAIADAKAGLLRPEAAAEAGQGLREICEAVGIPPVLHMGSCVDNSRILTLLSELAKAIGLPRIADLPVAGAAPEWMSEKAVSIGMYVVASGIFTVLPSAPILGGPEVVDILANRIEEWVGAKFAIEPDPVKAAHLMIDHIDKKRAALKLKPMMYEQPYPPKA